MSVHSPGLVFCRSNDLGMDFCWGLFWQFFRDFGGAQKYTLISQSGRNIGGSVDGDDNCNVNDGDGDSNNDNDNNDDDDDRQ